MTQTMKSDNMQSELRYAHIEGHTELDFIPGENKIVTVGVDCEVRVWALEDGEIKESFSLEDTIYSVALDKERVYVAMDDNTVKSFQLADGQLGEDERNVCRFTANATHLSMHRELIAAGAADFTIKLINLDDRSEKTYTGHTAPILSVALDPLSKYIASSSCDGSVCLWSIDAKSVQHQWSNVFPRSNDFENSSTLCRIAWQPDMGDCFAIPKPASLELYKRGQWEKPWKTVTHSELSDISIVTFSHDGKYIAVASTQSVVMVWSMAEIQKNNDRPLSALHLLDTSITSLRFNPLNAAQLCCCDTSGSLRILKIISLGTKTNNATRPTASTIVPSTPSQDLSFLKPAPVKAAVAFSQTDLEDMYDEIEDDDFSFVVEHKQEQTQKTSEVPTKKAIDRTTSVQKDAARVVEEIYAMKSITEPKASADWENANLDADLDNDYDAEFDIGAIKSKYEPIMFGDDTKVDATSTAAALGGTSVSGDLVIDGQRVSGKELLSLLRQPRVSVSTRQPSFQSGSTPVHYKQRFMVWNSVGIVYGYNTEEERSIDVEFHDASFHHSIHQTNMFNYTMADLSTACLILASNGDDEADDALDHEKARLFCMMFNVWDSLKEWQVDMPRDERIDAIATGHNFIAAATSQLFLRIWTIGGVQTTIVSLNGPAVNLSANERHLMILSHQAAHFAEQGQSIACQVLKVDHKGKTRCHPIATPVPVALSPKSTVYWAGFTDEGTPCIMDSDGIVRLYKSHFGKGWFPICATKEQANGRSDNFFIVGLSEIQAQIRCIFCKASRYPDTVPKPTLTILTLQIPLCEMFTSKSTNEEEFIRSKWLSSLLKKLSLDGFDVDTALEDSDKKVINSLIKLFALSLGADRESLAYEIASIMPNRNAVGGAIKYAGQKNHRSLAKKLLEMMQDEEEGNASDEDEYNSDTELQELMARKNVDQRQQVMVDEDSNGARMISLAKHGDQSNEVILKPKLMRGTSGRDSTQSRHEEKEEEDDDDVMEVADDEDGDENALRPIKIANVSNGRGGSKNPFKVTDQNKKSTNQRMKESALKRKQYEDEDDDLKEEAREETLPGKDTEEDTAFSAYYEATRDQLLEDNEDEVDTEEDLLRLAKGLFESLSASEKRKYQSMAKKASKGKSTKRPKKTATEAVELAKEEEPKVNKITNFFKRH